jgi:hypothetical protein
MTKKEMLDFIEKTGMVINFDYNYLMRHSKAYIETLYIQAVKFSKKSA